MCVCVCVCVCVCFLSVFVLVFGARANLFSYNVIVVRVVYRVCVWCAVVELAFNLLLFAGNQFDPMCSNVII